MLAPTGLLGYLLYVIAQTGSRDGWFGVQERGWGWTFDYGIGTAEWMGATLMSGSSVFDLDGVAVVLGSVVVLAVAVRRRLPWPVVVYAAGVLAMVLGSNGLMFTKARVLIPALVVLTGK